MASTTENLDDVVTQRTLALFGRKEHGQMNNIAYQNGGSALFENFTQNNPDYYPYEGEIQHIAVNKRSIARQVADSEHVIVVGPGPASSFSRKDYQIIALMPHVQSVHFIDLSERFNEQSSAFMQSSKFAAEFKKRTGNDLDIQCHHMDFHEAAATFKPLPKTCVISTGALISNLDNAPLDGFPEMDMQDELLAFRNLAGDQGYVILGYDSNDNPFSLERAYKKSAAFVTNITKIIGEHCKEISSSFKYGADYFRYEMEWVRKAHQVAHKLVVVKPQQFEIKTPKGPRVVNCQQGDEFIVMSSIKPPVNKMASLAEHVGLQTTTSYVDRHGLVEHVFKCVAARPVTDAASDAPPCASDSDTIFYASKNSPAPP